MGGMNPVDRELMTEFIDESMASLKGLPGLIQALPARSNDGALIESIYRPIHNLKGNAVFFGLFKVKKLAMTMERVLEELKNESLTVSKNMVSCMVEGAELILYILERARLHGRETAQEKQLNEVVGCLEALLDQRSDRARPPSESKWEKWRWVLAYLSETIAYFPEKTPERQRLETLQSLLEELAPAEAACESGSHDGGPIRELVALVEAPPEDLSEDGQIFKAKQLMDALEAQAVNAEIRGMVRAGKEALGVTITQEGYGERARHLLFDLAQTLAPRQQWVRKEDDKRLTGLIPTQQETRVAHHRAHATGRLLETLERLKDEENKSSQKS
jgi:chemotaxis protein histidine kinase CheA